MGARLAQAGRPASIKRTNQEQRQKSLVRNQRKLSSRKSTCMCQKSLVRNQRTLRERLKAGQARLAGLQ